MADKTSNSPAEFASHSSRKFGTVLSPEALGAGQTGMVRALLALSGQKGVLAGVQLGHADWDLRPLVLEKGVTSIIRFSSPKLTENPAGVATARDYIRKLSSLGSRLGVSAAGEAQERFWIKRPYYGALLAAQHDWWRVKSEAERSSLIKKLLAIFNDLKPHGLVHGHVCASNITLLSEPGGKLTPVLLDYGAVVLDPGLCWFWKNDPGRHGVEVAPEILDGHNVTEACDIYGLGLIFKMVYQEQSLAQVGSSDSSSFIARMLAVPPAERPALIEVIRVFAPAGLLREGVLRPPVSESGGSGIRSGKIITGSAASLPKKESAVLHHETELANFSQSQSEVKPEVLATPAAGAESLVKAVQPDRPTVSAAVDQGMLSREGNPHLVKLLVVLAVLVAILLMVTKWPQQTQMPADQSEADYTAAWTSNQQSIMAKVAEAALARPDSRARRVILKDAFSASQSRPGVRLNLIRVAFDPRWERSLSEEDRRTVLLLALQDLLSVKPRSLPALSEVHPAVVLAIAGNVTLGKAPAFLKDVGLEQLGELPPPYGAAFMQLKQLGLATAADAPAQALCQIFSGDTSDQVVAAFFEVENGKEAAQFSRLRILLPIMPLVAGLDRQVYSFLMQGGGSIRHALAWFDQEETVKWKDIPRSQIFGILTGTSAGQDLQLEHYVDLLKFPVPAVRSMAERRLVEAYLPEVLFSTASFLASPGNKLKRFQNVSLVFALKSNEGEGEGALLSAWFKSRPEPQSVLGLLLARKDFEKEDIFNLEAARYLAGVDFDISPDQLKALAGHPETLARALAISRLDAQKPEEAEILRAMSVVEPNERIRKQIREKVGGSEKH